MIFAEDNPFDNILITADADAGFFLALVCRPSFLDQSFFVEMVKFKEPVGIGITFQLS